MIQTTLKIDGMMCGMCEAHINDAIRNHFSVKKVSSSHKKGICEITSEEVLNEEELSKVIEETGYRIMSIESSEAKPKRFLFF